jgi:hypothetical protein
MEETGFDTDGKNLFNSTLQCTSCYTNVFVPFHLSSHQKAGIIVSILTIEKARQIPVAHELVNQNVLAFFHAVSNQINKISVMQPTMQNDLQTKKEWS